MRFAVAVGFVLAAACHAPAADAARSLQFSSATYTGITSGAVQVHLTLTDAGAAVPNTSIQIVAQCADGGACATPFGNPAMTDSSGAVTFTLVTGTATGSFTIAGNDMGSGVAAQPATATVTVRAASTLRSLTFNGTFPPVHIGSLGIFNVLVTDRPAASGGSFIPGAVVTLQGGCNAAGACITVDPPTGIAADSHGTARFTGHANFGGIGPVPMLMIDTATSAAVVMDANVEPLWNFQDMWWEGTRGNGWGLSILQHGERIFAVIFAYDDQGNPTWYVMPGGTWNETHEVYEGPIYTPHGTPYYAYQAGNLTVGNPVGTMQLQLTFQDMIAISYDVNFRSGGALLARQPFGPPGGSPVGDRADMWWGGSSQNGWGIAILEQAPTIFPIWYTYDSTGKAVWYVVPVGSFTSADVFEGRAYKTKSSSWLYDTYDATKLQATDAGSFVLHFSGSAAATLDYSVEGHGGTVPLSREPF